MYDSYNKNFTVVSHNCDISSHIHKQIEPYLKDKYGNDTVCHIINFGKFGAKTVIKDLCRIYELDFNLSNRLTSYFDTLKSELDISEQLEKARSIAKTKNENDIVKFIDDNKELFENIGQKLIGMVRSCGLHASGILISNKKLVDSDMPIYKIGDDIVTAVQEGGDEREVAELGYCKLDILGLKTAAVNEDAIREVEKIYDIKDLEKKLIISDMDDEEVYKRFQVGDCRDIFQFGSDNMIGLIKSVHPENIHDLACINGLWRPAAIINSAPEEFINNRKNIEETKKRLSNIHPALWEILEKTSGVMIFQENIMMIQQKLGGFSMAEADKGRKILKLLHKGNQDKNEAFNNMIKRFGEGMLNNGISEEDGKALLDTMGKYSEYSFNLSHCLGGDTEVITSKGIKTIKDIVVGDKVVSYDDGEVVESNVTNKFEQGRKLVYDIVFENGEKVRATLDHKFMTENGMLPLRNILENNLQVCSID